MVCDICDENSNSEIRKKGEFSYDFETQGMDFSDKNLSRAFRNLKTHAESCEIRFTYKSMK